MLRNLLCALMIFASPLALAQVSAEPQRFGDLLVYRTLFNSSFLQPDVAANTGLERGPNVGVVNILVQRQTPEGPVHVDAQLSGTVRNMLGQSQDLDFIRIQEEEAIYFVANYRAAQRGVLRFTVTVQGEDGGQQHQMQFQQEFHPDD
jgi:hypothetical protein